MRRMLVLTIAGGAVAAYFAYPQGFVASALAYLLGGTLCALLGLLGYMYASDPKARSSKTLAPSQSAAESSSARSKADL